MSEFNPLEPFTDAITEVANKTYDDTLHPSLNATGKSLSLIPRAINAALSPLEIWILKKEHNIAETKKLLEIKLANVSPEKIVSPEPYVAVPTIQALSYCMDCEELRDLFASLLASSMNSDKKDDVHPSFVEVIKNMNPLDAKIFKFLAPYKGSLPIVEYKHSFKDGSKFFPILKHVILIDALEKNVLKISASIHNIERLGLVNISYADFLSNEGTYDNFKKTDYFNSLQIEKSSHKELDEYTVDIQKGILSVTSYGKFFSSVTT